MRRFGVAGCALALLVGVAACRSGGATEAAKEADQKAAAVTPPDAPPADVSFDNAAPPRALVTLGMTRPIGAQAAIFSAKQLNAYLSRQLGGEVTTKLYDDSSALGDALSAGVVDAAWLTPTAYVRASERAAIKPIARLSRGGFTSYRSVIFTKAGAKAKTLEDLKGAKMAWVAEGSASGRAYPRAYMKRKGLDPLKFFGPSTDYDDHHGVCEAVLKGEAEAGASLSDERPAGEAPIVDGCREAGLDPKAFQVIERFGPIPNDVIAGRADLPEAIESKVRDALLQMAQSDEGRTQLHDIFRADGFAGVSDADFAPVREVQMYLEMK